MEQPQQLLLIWESEVTRTGDNQVTIRATRPLSQMTVEQAGRVLKLSRWTVRKLWRMGLLKGWKPGGACRRRDGRASNAALMLDAESVLAYKARQEAEAKREQENSNW